MAAEAKRELNNGRNVRRYAAVYAASGVGLLVGLTCFVLARAFTIELGASAFFLTYILAMLWRLRHMTPGWLRAHADESDAPAAVILFIALVTVTLAVASLFIVLNSGRAPDTMHLVLGILAVVLSWLGLNSMLAFHYAYEFYETDAASPVDKDGRKSHIGGLKFPGPELPDALSFLYFSFVVAMTAQVSDVTVTSNPMRKLVLLHGILAYFFNTVILATAVNIVVSLGH